MSRHILSANPKNRKLDNQSSEGKLILTVWKQTPIALLIQEDALIWAQTFDPKQVDRIGQIYIGKVKNVVPNINACFVEISDEEICYLSFEEAKYAYLSNKKVAFGQDVKLVQGDELPVQIIRNAIKTKPAAVSCALELQSDYFVIKTDVAGIGISNKISKNKSKHIKELLQTEQENSASVEHTTPFYVIVRTKCGELCDEDILTEYKKIRTDYFELFNKAKFRTCFSCIHSDETYINSVIRQIPSYEYDEIITDIEDIYNSLKTDENITKPSRFYQDESISLTSLYGLSSKLDNALAKKVWLRSGANLVIEQTECLTTIDVNSGKNIKGTLSEDIIYQINMEAAQEAALQIRLRNLSGIIIIDFINMKDKSNEKELLIFLSELTSTDPVVTRVVDMTPLGLVEITRKKIHMSLKEQLINEIY